MTYYLDIREIRGSSKAPGHIGQIELLSFSYGPMRRNLGNVENKFKDFTVWIDNKKEFHARYSLREHYVARGNFIPEIKVIFSHHRKHELPSIRLSKAIITYYSSGLHRLLIKGKPFTDTTTKITFRCEKIFVPHAGEAKWREAPRLY